ncbi:MAG: putative Ig domain-containing protein [Kiritimatiellae bacterium]|nr:putative Ig domain-containing protein [Kiritimatiellia bacterium]
MRADKELTFAVFMMHILVAGACAAATLAAAPDEGAGGPLAGLCITNAQGVVAGYQDLEYLDTVVEKSGNALSSGQRIVTDFRPQDSDVVEMTVKFLPRGFGCNQFLWCDRVDGAADTFSAGKMNSGCFRFDRGSSTSGAGKCPAAAGTLYRIVADYGSRACTVNGKSAGTMECAKPFSPPANLVLFASFVFEKGSFTRWNNHASVRFYSFKVRRGGRLVCHIVPVRRASDGALGAYDRVAGKFYANSGSGAFSAGLTRETPQPVIPTPQLGILTPLEGKSPRINGARVLGVRPGNPVFWRIPVTGERPMRFSVEGLPPGATFDAARGIIGGAVAARGTYEFTVVAENAHGRASRKWKLVVGDKIALTPPMGWNSWNCFNFAVTAQNIREAADAMVSSGLADHGWTYVNIDDFWQNNPYRFKDDPTLHGAERKPDGTINPNARFPDMKGLADYIHAKGLKAGLYSSPGPYTCGMCTGSWGHEWQDANTYADWGYDYLKYDLCTYNRRGFRKGMYSHKGVDGSSSLETATLPFRLMGEALAAQKRDIVFSLCQYGLANVSTWGENVGGQCWRTGGDFRDSFLQMSRIVSAQAPLWPYARPGAWNDPDMLMVGPISIGGIGTVGMTKTHACTFTHNEQYTHVSMWSILCAPLLIGCDLTKLDDFTRALLTNDEVIEVNQDELGAQAALVAKGPRAQVWAKPMHDGSLVFALFNTADTVTRIAIDYDSLGIEGKWLARDLWRQKDEGIFGIRYSVEVPGHATHLARLFPKEDARLAEGVRDIRMNSVYIQFEALRPVDKPGYKAPKSYPCERCDK